MAKRGTLHSTHVILANLTRVNLRLVGLTQVRIQADLPSVNLTFIDLIEVDLTVVDLTKVDPTLVDLTKVDPTQVDLTLVD